jgi:hypothetical protein
MFNRCVHNNLSYSFSRGIESQKKMNTFVQKYDTKAERCG